MMQINGTPMYSEVASSEGEGNPGAGGPPVLMLHGGFCSLESLQPQADALVAAGRTVYGFERPGHGRTPDHEGGFSYERSLEDTVAYLDAQQLPPVDVIGYSDGAILGLLLAMLHPERVNSLVSISANLDPSGFTDTGSEATPGQIILPPLPGGPVAGDSSVADASDPADPAATPTEPQDTYLGAAAEEPNNPDLEGLAYARLSPDGPGHAEAVLEKLFTLWRTQPDIDPAQLAGVHTRTLIMAGDRDSIRLDHSALIAASLPNARLSIVGGTTHGLVNQKPELLSVIIADFLAGDA